VGKLLYTREFSEQTANTPGVSCNSSLVEDSHHTFDLPVNSWYRVSVALASKGKNWLHHVLAATLLIVEDAKVDQISQDVRAAGGRVRVNSRLRCQAGTGMGV
jgi:hypothetical protein